MRSLVFAIGAALQALSIVSLIFGYILNNADNKNKYGFPLTDIPYVLRTILFATGNFVLGNVIIAPLIQILEETGCYPIYFIQLGLTGFISILFYFWIFWRFSQIYSSRSLNKKILKFLIKKKENIGNEESHLSKLGKAASEIDNDIYARAVWEEYYKNFVNNDNDNKDCSDLNEASDIAEYYIDMHRMNETHSNNRSITDILYDSVVELIPRECEIFKATGLILGMFNAEIIEWVWNVFGLYSNPSKLKNIKNYLFSVLLFLLVFEFYIYTGAVKLSDFKKRIDKLLLNKFYRCVCDAYFNKDIKIDCIISKVQNCFCSFIIREHNSIDFKKVGNIDNNFTTNSFLDIIKNNMDQISKDIQISQVSNEYYSLNDINYQPESDVIKMLQQLYLLTNGDT
jgi:hypothetical protein